MTNDEELTKRHAVGFAEFFNNPSLQGSADPGKRHYKEQSKDHTMND